jgi:hypothetical protein
VQTLEAKRLLQRKELEVFILFSTWEKLGFIENVAINIFNKSYQ